MTLRVSLARLLLTLATTLSRATPPAADDAERNTTRRPQNPQEAAIKELLETCARAFVTSGQHVRANVLTFTSAGARRRVNKSTAYNMKNDPDCDLEIDSKAAASGKAVSERRAAVADLVSLQISTAPLWGLRADEQARVRPTLKSILSVPVFNPDDVDGPLLGTLQVDSDLTMEEAGFNRPEAAELLQQFADVLSLLMIGVDVQLTDASTEAASPTPHSRVQNATQVEPGLYVANSSTSIFQLSKARPS